MPKILIVDDEPHITLLMEQIFEDFEERGVDILTADNGEEGLEIIKKEKPELVFLDIMMPIMNGFDVCDEVKNKLGLKDVYIILLTAKGQELDRKKGMEVGADMYVTKPFQKKYIIEKAAEVLGVEL